MLSKIIIPSPCRPSLIGFISSQLTGHGAWMLGSSGCPGAGSGPSSLHHQRSVGTTYVLQGALTTASFLGKESLGLNQGSQPHIQLLKGSFPSQASQTLAFQVYAKKPDSANLHSGDRSSLVNVSVAPEKQNECPSPPRPKKKIPEKKSHNLGGGATGDPFSFPSNTVIVLPIPPWQARPLTVANLWNGRPSPSSCFSVGGVVWRTGHFAVPLAVSDAPTPFLRNSPWRPTHQRPKGRWGREGQVRSGPHPGCRRGVL